MSQPSPILVLDKPCCPSDAALAGRQRIEHDLILAGRTIRVDLAVANVPLTLAQIVPLAHYLSDRVCGASCDQAALQGQTVSCRKGCSACCHYLVPMSVAEAFHLLESIQALDAGSRDGVVRAFVEASQKVLQAQPPHLPDQTCTRDGQTVSPAGAAGQWYARLSLPCPLLISEPTGGSKCSLYSHRPLACREHMVVSSPELCGGFHPGQGQIHRLPFSVLEAVGQLAAELEGTDVEAVMLTLAPAWTISNLDRAERAWPAPKVVRRLLAICDELARHGQQVETLPKQAA